MDSLSLSFRILSLITALGLVSVLSPRTAFFLMVFMGQAHFILAYWYKFEKIPHLLSSRYFLVWIATIAVCFAFTDAGMLTANFWFISAAILFAVHHARDDITLAIGAVSPLKILVWFPGIFLLYFVEVSEYIFGLLLLPKSLIVLSTIAVLVPTVAVFRKKSLPRIFGGYVVFLAVVSAYMIMVSDQVVVQYLLTFFVFTHYFLWYFEYSRKLLSSKSKLIVYTRRVLVINAAMFTIWFFAQRGELIPFYTYIFSDTFFYIWTCIHIVFSLPLKVFCRSGE